MAAADAQYISALGKNASTPANTWMAFRKDVQLKGKPDNVVLRIAADTKYWLWINGELAVFEGGLKRGPAPGEGYYDEVDVTSFLKKGRNRVAVLLWYFGKSGFSHESSGKAALIVDSDVESLRTDSSWMCRVHPAYGTAAGASPNYRLSESNISFDARKDMVGWQTSDNLDTLRFKPAVTLGVWGTRPWGELKKRPIPMWHDFGVKEALFERVRGGNSRDVISVRLPYNMQFTPVLTLVDEKGGQQVDIKTDHSSVSGMTCISAVYTTKIGRQEYESFGWMNGEVLTITVPHNVVVKRVAYRETGYDTTFDGKFTCSDDFFNKFWVKGQRTLYVNMRDNFFDCPDRERAQWWGDVCVMLGECFYTCSTSTHQLIRKAIGELCHWQKAGGELYSPIPGNYRKELPAQMLASVGLYGFWNYYMNTGDEEAVKQFYPSVKRYLALWNVDKNGLTSYRRGDWDWGDWGDNMDMRLILAAWHYMALDAAAQMAEVQGIADDAKDYRRLMAGVKSGFNLCWSPKGYRGPGYHGAIDDRVQALAIVSGIAEEDKYDQLYNAIKREEHASPYMEGYVMEALFRMGHGDYGLERVRKRYGTMIDDTLHTTLYEKWRLDGESSSNHAWSGGPLTVMGKCLMGIMPTSAGYKTFSVHPQPSGITRASLSFPTVSGIIKETWKVDRQGVFTMTLVVPKGTQAQVQIPQNASGVKCDGKRISSSTTTMLLDSGKHRFSFTQK